MSIPEQFPQKDFGSSILENMKRDLFLKGLEKMKQDKHPFTDNMLYLDLGDKLLEYSTKEEAQTYVDLINNFTGINVVEVHENNSRPSGTIFVIHCIDQQKN